MITDIVAAKDAALADIKAAASLEDIVALTTRYAGIEGRTRCAEEAVRQSRFNRGEESGRCCRQRRDDGESMWPSTPGAPFSLPPPWQSRSKTNDSISPNSWERRLGGHAHLATQAWERLEDVFVGLGFRVAEGPEVETDWHNFEALNMPVGHPARRRVGHVVCRPRAARG